LPLMPLVCVTAILGGVLQVRGRFGVPAALPIVINAAIIAAGGWMLLSDAEPRRAGTAIALAAVGAGAVQIAVALRALRGRLRLTVRVRSAAGDAKRTLAAFVPVAVGMGTLQLNTLADTVLAMWPTWIGPTLLGRAVPMDAASNAILGFTQRLYQFPLGVFGLAVATAAFPQLARAAGDPARFAQTIARGARLSLFIGLPASAGLWLVRDDLIRVVFSGGGGFSEHGLARAGAVLAGYAVAVWAYGLNHLLVRSFYARHDTTTPMRISLAMVGVNVGLNLVLIWRFREAGLAWSTAATAVIQTGVLAVLVGRRGGPPPESLVRPVLRTLSATAVMAVAVAGAAAALGLAQDAGGREWSGSLVRLVVMVGVGGGVYLGVARVLRCDELGWLLSRSVKVEREDER
ncbi:MAG: lipid II flippase MurJ, partial [Planctomycetota bacterium]